MEVIITKGQIEDIEVIAQFQVDMAMESEGTLLDKETVHTRRKTVHRAIQGGNVRSYALRSKRI